MLAVDTSIVVAAFAEWHERHAEAVAALADGPSVAAHSVLESYSVLTRLPAPLRMAGDVVLAFLSREFPSAARLTLDPRAQRDAADRLGSAGLVGGAVYDGFVALTAAAAGAPLLSLDERAMPTYLRVGAQARLID